MLTSMIIKLGSYAQNCLINTSATPNANKVRILRFITNEGSLEIRKVSDDLTTTIKNSNNFSDSSSLHNRTGKNSSKHNFMRSTNLRDACYNQSDQCHLPSS